MRDFLNSVRTILVRTELVILGLIFLIAGIGFVFQWTIGIEKKVIGIVCLSLSLLAFIRLFITWRWDKAQKRNRIQISSSIDAYLKQALEIMDSTASWYNDENEANRELVTCLKSLGLPDVEYQFRLGNGRIADARVGQFLIEGKLSPDTRDTDTLIGQMNSYSRFTDKLIIVIYGGLAEDSKKRITEEISDRYPNKVFLTYLDHPKRQRTLPD